MRRNNFDFLRITATLLVMYTHQFVLQGTVEPVPALPYVSWGGIGVAMFFVLSGFLVTKSWCEDPAPHRYLARRFLRIWPALAVGTLATVFVLGPLVTRLPVGAYWASPETWAYLSALKLFTIHFNLPGVFVDNPYAGGVNGSLWTIPVEVRCYLVLMLLGWMGALRIRWLSVAALFTLAFVAFVLGAPGENASRNWNHELGAFFAAGSVLYLWRDVWMNHAKAVFGIALVLAGVAWAAGWPYVAIFLALPPGLLAFGNAATPVVCRVGRFGDPSYGLYIFAFPIQQLVVMATSNQLGVFESLALAVALTFFAAYLSWHLVEKVCLGFKPRTPLPARRVQDDLLMGSPAGSGA